MNTQLSHFIKQKNRAICFYIEQLLQQQMPAEEITLFLWDTLEEWLSINVKASPMNPQEQVFWHLFYLLHYQHESSYESPDSWRHQLMAGVSYLKAKGPMLPNCIGIRP